MPSNPAQDGDRPDDQPQDEGKSQAKIWPKSPDQQDKPGRDRLTNADQPSPESSNRVPGTDEGVEGQDSSREDDEEIARKMSQSGKDDRSKGSGG
jgi:hypothetical protein